MNRFNRYTRRHANLPNSLVYPFHFPTPPWFFFVYGDGDDYWARVRVYLMKTGNYGQFLWGTLCK